MIIFPTSLTYIPVNTQAQEAIAPVDKSIPPVNNTNDIPPAINIRGAISSIMFFRPYVLKNLGLIIVKNPTTNITLNIHAYSEYFDILNFFVFSFTSFIEYSPYYIIFFTISNCEGLLSLGH